MSEDWVGWVLAGGVMACSWVEITDLRRRWANWRDHQGGAWLSREVRLRLSDAGNCAAVGHECNLPSLCFPWRYDGRRWKCDTCEQIWVIDTVYAGGDSFKHWIRLDNWIRREAEMLEDQFESEEEPTGIIHVTNPLTDQQVEELGKAFSARGYLTVMSNDRTWTRRYINPSVVMKRKI